MPTAKMNATIFASALKSSSCCINIVFGFGGKSKSDATIPDVVGCRSPSFALIGYGICLESEKIYTFVGEYSKGACLNIHHSLFPAVKRGNLKGKQAGRLNFVHRLCGVRSDCFRVFHDLTAADCSPHIFKIFCYLCHCNKGTPTYSRPVQKESKRQNLIERQAGQVELRAYTARGSAVCFVALCRA